MNPIFRLVIMSFVTAILMIHALRPDLSFTAKGMVYYWMFVLVVLLFTGISMQIKIGVWKWAMEKRKEEKLENG